MLVKSTPAEQRTVLHNVSWETFEALLRYTGEDRGSRFAYDCGTLEILKFYKLVESQYIEIKLSMAFTLISVGEMNRFIHQSKTIDEIDLVQSFRAWVREKIG
ncbi:hypothetical protein NIES4074_31400 [Cylindrospermum sp. NIES-4074]|nr:hypothetical protein NIES4074_31400 [Cylindrospermum sp. NIES-4074]